VITRCLQRERTVRGWSLAELAERSAMSKAALSRIERGEMSPAATAQGDCLGFGPPVEVTFANQTAAPCIYLVVLARS